MISTGYPYTAATEVMDLKDSNVTCEDLKNFTMEIRGAVGANLASTPIICGGYFDNYGTHIRSEKCFKYMDGGWQHFATMIERRSYAVGIVYNNAFHIFGGYEHDDNDAAGTTFQSSEIIKEDGISIKGPQLPTPLFQHAIAYINSTTSIITGGQTSDNSYNDKTWYFNHVSQKFQRGPDLLEVRDSKYYVEVIESHASGSVTDQETKEKMAIIAGGIIDMAYSNSTKMLLNGEWKAGKTHTESHICLFVYTFS